MSVYLYLPNTLPILPLTTTPLKYLPLLPRSIVYQYIPNISNPTIWIYNNGEWKEVSEITVLNQHIQYPDTINYAKQCLLILKKGNGYSQAIENGKVWTFKNQEASSDIGVWTSGSYTFGANVLQYPSGGLATASSTYSGSYLPSYAFDTDTTNWWASSTTAAWLRYDFLSPMNVIQYGIRGSYNIVSGPKNWTFEGSNDNGNSWSILHTVTNYSWSNITTIYTFNVTNPGSYLSYRLNISSNNGHPDGINIGDFKFLFNNNIVGYITDSYTNSYEPNTISIVGLLNSTSITNDINSLVKIKISLDGGSNWTSEKNFTYLDDYDSQTKMFYVTFNQSDFITSGKLFMWKIIIASGFNVNILGIGMFWN